MSILVFEINGKYFGLTRIYHTLFWVLSGYIHYSHIHKYIIQVNHFHCSTYKIQGFVLKQLFRDGRSRTHAPPVAPAQPLATPSTKSLCIDPAGRPAEGYNYIISLSVALIPGNFVVYSHTLSPHMGLKSHKNRRENLNLKKQGRVWLFYSTSK